MFEFWIFSLNHNRGNILQSIAEFNLSLQADVLSSSSENGLSSVDAFFEYVASRLEDAGEIEMSERAAFEATLGAKHLRVDGSGGDPRDCEGVLSMVVCDYRESEEPQTLNASDAKRLFGQLINFLVSAQQDQFRSTLTLGSPAAGLAETIALTWCGLSKVKLILITNAVNSARTDAVPAGLLNKIPVTYNVWDLARFQRFEASGQANEELVINFKADYGKSVPALAASRKDEELESYLMVIPGVQLADIYEKWGARLLESNVRSFLQARAKVNKGIRDTIKNEPEMFFSFNNGLSATAESVVTEVSADGLKIVSAHNLQIVNGCQTTASIHAAKKISAASLHKVLVQMKLTVVPQSRSEVIVPRISETANSQNKVTAADFFSNHPFHVRIEEYSRKVLAPARQGTNRETQWFYERARGQYLVGRSNGTEAERKKFDITFPKEQLFAKTDLAKAEFSFFGKPHVVSKGAQKNFAEFAVETGIQWARNNARFDETWFTRLVAKLIVFRYLEKVVPVQDWYPGGYRANIVTYSIAKVSADAEAMNALINLDTVWRAQSISDDLSRIYLKAAKAASDVLTKPILGIKNTTEWAKKQACWERLRTQQIDYEGVLQNCVVSLEDDREAVRDGKRNAAIVSGIEAQTRVVTTGKEFWLRLQSWGESTGTLSPRELNILRSCSMPGGRLPSEKQAIVALQILSTSCTRGYHDELEVPRVKIGNLSRVH